MPKKQKKSFELPEEWNDVNLDCTIKIRKGKVTISSSSSNQKKQTALCFALRHLVFHTPLWSDENEKTVRNPDVGAILTRWIFKSQKGNPIFQTKEWKTFVEFSSLETPIMNNILIGEKKRLSKQD